MLNLDAFIDPLATRLLRTLIDGLDIRDGEIDILGIRSGIVVPPLPPWIKTGENSTSAIKVMATFPHALAWDSEKMTIELGCLVNVVDWKNDTKQPWNCYGRFRRHSAL